MGRVYYKRGVGPLFYSQPVERFDKTKRPVKFASLSDGYGAGDALYMQKQEYDRVMARHRSESGSERSQNG